MIVILFLLFRSIFNSETYGTNDKNYIPVCLECTLNACIMTDYVIKDLMNAYKFCIKTTIIENGKLV